MILKEEQLRFAIDTTSLVLENVSQLAEKNDTTDIIQIIKELKSISILLAFSSSKCLTSDQEAETFVFRVCWIFEAFYFSNLAVWLPKFVRPTIGSVHQRRGFARKVGSRWIREFTQIHETSWEDLRN